MRPVLGFRNACLLPLLFVVGGCAQGEAPKSPSAEVPAPAKSAKAAKASPLIKVIKPATPTPTGPPIREANRKEIEETIEALIKVVKPGAQDPTNPWAMAHGLLAFGAELKASDGRLAIDVIVQDFARLETVANKKVYGFDVMTEDKTPVEPHPDLLVKAIVEAGVPLSRKFKLNNGKTVTLQRLVDDAAWALVIPRTQKEWQRFAWSLSLFMQAYGKQGSIKTQSGNFTVSGLVDRIVFKLEKEQAFLLPAMSEGRPDLVQKRKQGIFAHTCGGLHFVQTAVAGAGRVGNPATMIRAEKQMTAVDFRWDAERRVYREMIRTQPKYRLLLLVQELKFHGHVLETMAQAHEWGVRPADDATRAQARRVAADLIDAIRELTPMYNAQAKLKESVPQSYYDLIGDGCHAIRGLRQTLVAFFAPPTSP